MDSDLILISCLLAVAFGFGVLAVHARISDGKVRAKKRALAAAGGDA